ncbi:MerR family DNA-binding transcriptional regulator [Rathayibacter sp. VKM Ac-2804]|jgi:DNA-binding transcriptional MerR regulator|uniref:MerR family transcriptional regulator n=1 Tax=unclassified Rathayibacter TaxID=2609250 RepID=UPI00132E93CF|nr:MULTISPECIES: MerR family transcriptional regulator [unclassified Rathayibacter]NRG42372.1 MerR family transcriptional regulator [Rathayibacter sp. VKM Ac-2835]QHF22853.1 MerR family DNA-binding transcriptional regulator [Rathayibacter sp. VKM Ac-2804]
MRIGELSKRTGVPSRMLRYYEEQGLITPRRLDNGYREYDDYLIDRVGKIRGLIDAGIPTRIVTSILPCLGQPQTIVVENAEPGLVELLETERDRMSEKIDFLTHNRDALTSYLEALTAAGVLSSQREAS